MKIGILSRKKFEQKNRRPSIKIFTLKLDSAYRKAIQSKNPKTMDVKIHPDYKMLNKYPESSIELSN